MSNERPQSDSGLLELPKELRLLIYDSLFQPLVERPEVLDTYALPDEWPDNDLSSYTNLTLSCEQIHNEAKEHFETHFLCKLTVYFETTPQLHSFHQTVSKLGEAYQNIQCSLRTPCDFPSSHQVDYDIRKFTRQQCSEGTREDPVLPGFCESLAFSQHFLKDH